MKEKLFVGMVLLGLCFPLLRYGAGFRSFTLAGVAHTKPFPEWRWDRLSSGQFQSAFSEWVNGAWGRQDVLIRTNNQLLYSFFGEPGPTGEGIVIGRDGMLYSKDYVESYFQLFPSFSLDKTKGIVQTMGIVQRLLRQRGISFVVLITPSKASLYPEYLPKAYAQFSTRKNNAHYEEFVQQLSQQNINLVDGHRLLAEVKKNLDFPLYPRGGIHWNDLGMFHVLRGLITEINRVSPRPMSNLTIESYEIDYTPRGSDRDLLDILNLWWPPEKYPVPRVKVTRDSPDSTFRPRVLVEGGSYNYPLLGNLVGHGLVSSCDFFNYYSWIVHYPDPTLTHVKIEKLNWEKEVFGKDVIVLEINEMYITDDLDRVGSGFLKDLHAQLTNSSAPTLH